MKDGSKVTLTADYTAKLQSWLDHQPQPLPDSGLNAPDLSWAGKVGEVKKSHKSKYMGLTFYYVSFSEDDNLDAWYLRSELEREAAPS